MVDAQPPPADPLQLAYVLSHDLRARTRAIQGHARLLQATLGERLDDAAGSHLQQIRDAATQADALLADIVDWLRVDGTPLKLVPVDLAFLADWAAADLQAMPGQPPINLEMHGDAHLTGDERLLQLMLRELLRHAAAGSAAGEPVQVRIQIDSLASNMLRLCISDSGGPCRAAGFDATAPFVAFSDATRTVGSGFSLAIARRVAQRHGGDLLLRNAEGDDGCLVVVELRDNLRDDFTAGLHGTAA